MKKTRRIRYINMAVDLRVHALQLLRDAQDQKDEKLVKRLEDYASTLREAAKIFDDLSGRPEDM